jgi:dephospho-CoA kinase
MLVGLTGGVASGKSTVAALLADAGVPGVDTDRIAHELLDDREGPVYAPVLREFGPDILDGDQNIDRRALASVVFGDTGRRETLERLLHPAIEEIAMARTAALLIRHACVVLEVPLLFEAGWEARVDMSVVVDCDPAVQVARFAQRTGATVEEARARVANQMERKERLARADHVIDNSKDMRSLVRQVEELLARLNQVERSNER